MRQGLRPGVAEGLDQLREDVDAISAVGDTQLGGLELVLETRLGALGARWRDAGRAGGRSRLIKAMTGAVEDSGSDCGTTAAPCRDSGRRSRRAAGWRPGGPGRSRRSRGPDAGTRGPGADWLRLRSL